MDDQEQWVPEDAAKALNKAIDEMEISPKKKRPMRYAAWDGFSDFCGHTSIHGVQFLGEEGRHWSERVLWAICILSSFSVCCYFIHNIWNKWEETPVIVSFSETSTPIWDIPFPAVTICPQTKTRRDIFNFTDFYYNTEKYMDRIDSDKMTKRFLSLALVCDPEVTQGLPLFYDEDYNIVETLNEIAPDYNSIVKNCKFNKVPFECQKFFHKIITDSGICFTFNSLPPQELFVNEFYSDIMPEYGNISWTLEDGYDRTVEIDSAYPEHLHISGTNRGLDIYLDTVTSDIDINCRGLVQGYNVLIHSPDELPQVSKQNFRLPLGKEIVVNVNPEMTTTSPSLRKDKVEKRQCYFNDERTLNYFKIYNQNNCEIECLANYTLVIAGCVPYWIPVQQNIPVCNATTIEAQSIAESGMHSIEFAFGMAKVEVSGELKVWSDLKCDCLPACTSIRYSSDTSQADFFETKHKKLNTSEPTKGSIRSRLKVGFAVSQFITSKRSELYGLNDFIANCGGLMGLFLGISALSFVEIFYFCSYRLVANKKLIKNTE